ncbi:hypothetical protein EV143_10351 [Flavobacterium chryseum]|uniref:hypothetical protein n=1 Tax=Flavobacterium sp. P3160 TaxID=2512113 RepID=UPI00105D4CE4|nr:hypothetical protein [Flavobacterium sp. P3160]TDO77819.1 hypothetical protein EV143_10351 [Flavobacterium sp. P3160]
MNKIFFLLLLFTAFSFAQEANKKNKIIRGFVFEDYLIPAQVEISVKGTDLKTFTDADGKFVIQAKLDDVLVISSFGERPIEITVTEKNCYTAQLFKDTGLYYYTKKAARIVKKIRRKAMRKYKQGFYDCDD